MAHEPIKLSTKSKGYEFDGFKADYLFSGIRIDKYNMSPFIAPDRITRVLIEKIGGDSHVFGVDEFEKVIEGFFNNRTSDI